VKRLRGRQVSLGVVVWIVVGLLVAANHHFLEHLDTLSRVLSAVLAVAVWPLVVLHVHFGI
jgi:ABC-type nitrate/sulfonate/bicarbonate transport system permease component